MCPDQETSTLLSPQAGLILLNEIAPRLRSAIPSAVSFVGCVNAKEPIQDAICIAARILDSVETREGLRRQAISRSVRNAELGITDTTEWMAAGSKSSESEHDMSKRHEGLGQVAWVLASHLLA